jgi:hypothetical protein
MLGENGGISSGYNKVNSGRVGQRIYDMVA